MKFWFDTYGEDADGNRGQKVIDYDFDNSAEEREEIVECLYERFLEEQVDGMVDVDIYCNLIDDNITVEVDIENYIDDLIAKARADEKYKDDLDFHVWLCELTFDRPQNKLSF